MNIVSVSDFRSNISQYLNRINYNDDVFLIKKGTLVVAQVAKPQTTKTSAIKTEFVSKWSGAFKVIKPLPANKIRDLIDYSGL